MKIEVHLYASLAAYLPKGAKNKSCILDLPDQADVEVLINQLHLPDKSVKLIFLNGIHANRTATMADGDRVGIFPPVGGG